LFFETGCHYVAQADLELMILLSQSPKCWDYRCVALHPEKEQLLCDNRSVLILAHEVIQRYAYKLHWTIVYIFKK
jgi:hypothetical protein